MDIEKVKIGDIKLNKTNPRIISEDKMRQLVNSVKEFPEMLKIRPIVVDSNNVVLGGNMRLQACTKAGLEEIYIIKADNLTESQKREFIIKDNVGFGEWDWGVLDSDWDIHELDDWGLEIPAYFDEESSSTEKSDDQYSTKIEAPTYEITGDKPEISEMFDINKSTDLIKEIEAADIEDPEVVNFLKAAAYRHQVFNYKKVAEFYAHSDEKIQDLMEKSALVIIDFEKAIENGYVLLSKELEEMRESDE